MPPSLHAVLGASSAKRWMACPPSARLEEKLKARFGDAGSEYAAEGTKAHALGELKIRHALGEINKFNFDTQCTALGDIPGEMDRATDSYMDIVMEKYYAAKRASPDAKILLEQRLDFSKWVPHGFGTGDVIIVSDVLLEVIDLKYGKGVPVIAEENPQARLYGLGGLELFGALYGFEHICNTIIQPRLESVTEERLTRTELLEWAQNDVRPVAEQAWRGEGEFAPGDHCQFCAAKAICAARAAQALSIFQHGFDEPGVLSDAAIPGILSVLDTAEKWIKDIRAYALNQALRGQQWIGFKLVRGRKPNRSWTDEEEATSQLIRAGYTEDQYSVKKLRSIAEIEKTLGKPAFGAILGQFVTQGEGALTLAPESDKRAAYSSADADFSDMAKN